LILVVSAAWIFSVREMAMDMKPLSLTLRDVFWFMIACSGVSWLPWAYAPSIADCQQESDVKKKICHGTRKFSAPDFS
jgi:hypothetical protein